MTLPVPNPTEFSRRRPGERDVQRCGNKVQLENADAEANSAAAPMFVSDNWEIVTLSDDALDDTDKEFAVPAGFEYQLLWVWVELITVVTAANRQMRVTLRDGSNDVIGQVRAGATQAASLTRFYMFAPALADLTAFRDTDYLMTPFPPTVFLTAGQNVRVRVNLAQAGDDMVVKMQVARRPV